MKLKVTVNGDAATLSGSAFSSGQSYDHGTNTLEETAWLLHLVVPGDAATVVTGAMRPASALSGDGPLNLVNAVRVAASPEAKRLDPGIMGKPYFQIKSWCELHGVVARSSNYELYGSLSARVMNPRMLQ
mgnify:CR=1 FL=1